MKKNSKFRSLYRKNDLVFPHIYGGCSGELDHIFQYIMWNKDYKRHVTIDRGNKYSKSRGRIHGTEVFMYFEKNQIVHANESNVLQAISGYYKKDAKRQDVYQITDPYRLEDEKE